MTENKYTNFNTEPLLNKINDLLKKEVDILLSDFMDRHNLLEQTHTQIMNLPSVKYELNRDNKYVSCSVNSCCDDKIRSTVFENIHDMTVKIVKNEVKTFEDKLATIEEKINSLYALINRVIETREVINLCCDVKIKEEPTSECAERENITLEIIDPNSIDEASEEDSSSESEDEDEDEDEDEELFEIEIDGINYCTNNEDNGLIYLMTADGDVGEKVGYLKQGEPFFDEDDK